MPRGVTQFALAVIVQAAGHGPFGAAALALRRDPVAPVTLDDDPETIPPAGYMQLGMDADGPGRAGLS